MTVFINKTISNKKSLYKFFKSNYGIGNYSLKQLQNISGVSIKTIISFIIYNKKLLFDLSIKNILPVILNKLIFYTWNNKKKCLLFYVI